MALFRKLHILAFALIAAGLVFFAVGYAITMRALHSMDNFPPPSGDMNQYKQNLSQEINHRSRLFNLGAQISEIGAIVFPVGVILILMLRMGYLKESEGRKGHRIAVPSMTSSSRSASCFSCGTRLDAGDEFCPACGTKR